MTRDGSRHFSASYTDACDRFREAAAARGAKLHTLPIDARGPDGESLAIDIAWIGAARPDSVLVHCSGLHGVEGFAGSAIQLALLDELPVVPDDAAVVLVHILNPYGMAWLRRVSEGNVDLNRNFLFEEGSVAPTSDGYRRVEPLLNPQSPPASDFFTLRAAAVVLRHGLGPMTAAVAQGQYEYPKGLFYGGAAMEQGVARYIAWVRGHLSAVKRGFAVDVHTGLGARGGESIFLRRRTGTLRETAGALGRRVTFDGGDGNVGYRIRGGHGGLYEKAPKLSFVTQEFGTYPSLKVVHALREENRWHHHGGGGIDHVTKRQLKELFAPDSKDWRNGVVGRGVSLARAACRYAFA